MNIEDVSGPLPLRREAPLTYPDLHLPVPTPILPWWRSPHVRYQRVSPARVGITLRGAGPLTRLSIDIALWDIKGKILGVPVWQLLGGKVRENCPVYGWIGKRLEYEEA
jgi:hypothetical protein